MKYYITVVLVAIGLIAYIKTNKEERVHALPFPYPVHGQDESVDAPDPEPETTPLETPSPEETDEPDLTDPLSPIINGK